MDFRFTEEQDTIRELARGILEKEVTSERLKGIERNPEWFDRDLWSKLAEANLLGIAVPEALGGMGFGLLELCVLLEEVGRAVAPLPALPALVLGGLPIAELGAADQKQRWLGPLAAGEAILSGALEDAQAPVQVRPEGAASRLHGARRCVPFADAAARIVVPAGTGAAAGLFLVDPDAPGVALEAARTSTGEPLFTLRLEAAPAERLGAAGPDALAWLHERALVATAALQVGVCERALEITARHVTEREQFGVPIGSFQAVQQRAADAWIDVAALRWVTWRAAWRLAQGLPAAREAAVAKFWAADAGARIAATAQHLHGGLGVDLDYPIHRYFLWSKRLELQLGAAAPQLAWLGRDMAASGPSEAS